MNTGTDFIELERWDPVEPRKLAVQLQKIEYIDLLCPTIYLASGKSINVTKESAEKAYKCALRHAIQ